MFYPTLEKYGGQPKGGKVWSNEEINKFIDAFRIQNANDLSQKSYKIISLGDCCFTRQMLTWTGIKPSKAQGELSHPFDLSANELKNIAECIRFDFKHFCDPDFLKGGSHSMYGGIYPHEADGLSMPDAIKFRIKYYRRIANFYEDVHSGKPIFFIHVTGKKGEELVKSAERTLAVLSDKFKDINYKFVLVNESGFSTPECFDQTKNIYVNHDIPYTGYKWHEIEHLHTDAGLEHSCVFALKIKEIILKSVQ